MPWIADLHIHSHFSIATSRELVPEHLDFHARRKGIRLLGTGDATHPGWLTELREKLVPAAGGLYSLRPELRLDRPLPAGVESRDSPLFMITAEISTIYKRDGRVRKVHHLVLLSGIEAAHRLQQSLALRGANIISDGRPILGVDSRDLLEIVLEADSGSLFIPAHIWTPWFSALGSRSGFDSIPECYRDLAGHIHAVETGLSTDPPMNWICRHLDKYTLVSNSDAHSPDRIGRNALLLETDFDFDAVVTAIRAGNPENFLGTIDLFPQQGKYHFDGHRKCGVCWNPLQTLAHHGLCSHCGRPVTEGVLNRVAQLADREDPRQRPRRRPFYSIIPLREILAELCCVGPASRRVAARYDDVLDRVGPEMDILLSKTPDAIRDAGFPELAEAVDHMRRRRVRVKEGYDGKYGLVTVSDANTSPLPLLSFAPSEFQHKRTVERT